MFGECSTRSVEEGIPKRSLGTRNKNLEAKASALGVFLESKASALGVFLESKALALGVFLSLAISEGNRGINP